MRNNNNWRLNKMKKVNMILVVALLAISVVISCGPSPEKLVVGTWETPEGTNWTSSSKIIMNDDYTFEKFSENPDTGVKEKSQTGTWELEDNIISMTILQKYDSSTESYIDITDGDTQKIECNVSVTEDSLGLAVVSGGNTETWLVFGKEI
jgi:hypothetical protein